MSAEIVLADTCGKPSDGEFRHALLSVPARIGVHERDRDPLIPSSSAPSQLGPHPIEIRSRYTVPSARRRHRNR